MLGIKCSVQRPNNKLEPLRRYFWAGPPCIVGSLTLTFNRHNQITFSTVKGFDSFVCRSDKALTMGSDFLFGKNNTGIRCNFKFNLSANIFNFNGAMIYFHFSA